MTELRRDAHSPPGGFPESYNIGKENKKRKYLLKEVSAYLVRK